MVRVCKFMEMKRMCIHHRDYVLCQKVKRRKQVAQKRENYKTLLHNRTTDAEGPMLNFNPEL